MVVLRTLLCLLVALHYGFVICGADSEPTDSYRSFYDTDEPAHDHGASESTEAPTAPRLTAAPQLGKRSLLTVATKAPGNSAIRWTTTGSHRCQCLLKPTSPTSLFLDHCALLC
jgi:hypothetical protein